MPAVRLCLARPLPGTDLHLGLTCQAAPECAVAATLPRPSAQGALHVWPSLAGTATLPRPRAAGVAVPARSLTASARIPSPAASARIAGETNLLSTATLPAPHAGGRIGDVSRLIGAASLPAPSVSGSGAQTEAQPVTAAATLPAPKTSGRVVRAATRLALHRRLPQHNWLHLGRTNPPPPGQPATLSGSVTVVSALTVRGAIVHPSLAVGAARLPAPLASGRLEPAREIRLAATLPAPRAHAATAYDPNLLSGTVNDMRAGWSPVEAFRAAIPRSDCGVLYLPVADAASMPLAIRTAWDADHPLSGDASLPWQQAEFAAGNGGSDWRDAVTTPNGQPLIWRQAEFASGSGGDAWRDGLQVPASQTIPWIQLALLTLDRLASWNDGDRQGADLSMPFGDGARLDGDLITRWRQATYPGHWIRPKPPKPPPPPRPPTLHRLCLGRPLPGTHLRLGLRCSEALPRRYYLVLNTAILLRLPDRTPLPCTGLTISTDSNSWCWTLSANLFGSDAYDLVAPQAPAYLPREVEATVNGYTWQFLLDTPSRDRAFARDSVSLSGRSRSAWLAAPYATATTGTQTDPTTAAQAATLALDNTGWQIDWPLGLDWAIPSGVLSWSGTPLDRVSQLVKTIDGCLMTHPSDDLLIVRPRYPSPPWTWGGIQPDALIPESAAVSIKRAPDWRPFVNGVYVSGTIAGVIASAKITGTDGAQQAEMIAEPLICDEEGIAARARALAVLSAGGPGSTLTAEMLLLPSDHDYPPYLVTPGQLVGMGAVRALARGVSIDVRRDQNGLGVRQTVTLEQREVEA